MATRFYLPSTTGAPKGITPTISAEWEKNLSNPRRSACFTTKTSSSMTTVSASGSDSVTTDEWFLGQFITPPLASNTTFGSTSTVDMSLYCYESSTSCNAYAMVWMRYCDEDGTGATDMRGNWDVQEMGTSSMKSAYGGANTLDATFNLLAGQRLIFEVGYYKQSTGTYGAYMKFGDNAASDAPKSDGDTNDYNSWVELSVNCTFASDATNFNQLMLMGVGT